MLTINWNNPSDDYNDSDDSNITIIMMTPKQYFDHTDILYISRRDTSKSAINRYIKRMKTGNSINCPSLYLEKDICIKQEGRYCLMAAEQLGHKKIPVIIYEYL